MPCYDATHGIPLPTVERMRHELRARLLEVRAVEQLTPSVRRIVFSGELADFTSLGADDHVKLLFAPDGTSAPSLPRFDGGIRYPEGVTVPAARDFTPRRFDCAQGVLVIDFVIHENGGGPASRWAASAVPGAVIGQAGPRGSLILSEDFDWYLLAGDETALPAIGRRLEELPARAQAIVIAEVADAQERVDLNASCQLEVTWLYRGHGGKPDRGELERAVRSLELPSGAGFAWVAGEADAVRPLRRYLREELDLPKQFTRVSGYWRRGTADHHDPPERD